MDKYKQESGLHDSSEGLSKLLFDIKPLTHFAAIRTNIIAFQ